MKVERLIFIPFIKYKNYFLQKDCICKTYQKGAQTM